MKFVCLFLLFLLPAALADELPDLGESSQAVLTAQDEQQIAEEILRDVAASDDVVSDIEVLDYLQNLGDRLAANSPDKRQHFTFFVVKDNSINAFALPGGVIGVHTGLIQATTSESELASVLAHEIGHVVQRHLARMVAMQRQDAWKSFAAMAFALLAARSNPQLASASMQATQAGAVQKQLDYTREHEREADRVGLQILNQSGLDTRAMPAFFEQLMKGTRFYDGGAPAFLRTHPLTTERISDIQNRVEQLPYRQVPDNPEFQFVRAKLRASLGNPQQMVAWFEDNLAQRKYTNEASQHYGLAVALIRANQLARAKEQVLWLEDHAGPARLLSPAANANTYVLSAAAPATSNAMVETLAAGLETAMGNRGLAESRYRQALNRYPAHRGLIYGYAEWLLAAGQSEAALKLIAEKQRLYPTDAYLYELKSQAYTQQGKQLLRHQAQGEAYYLRYDLPAAIEQMELAVKAADGDFYQLSIVEARLKQWRQQLGDPKDKKS